ncbi:MAG: thiamine-phosphate kinase [Nitrospiraceae bacterium]
MPARRRHQEPRSLDEFAFITLIKRRFGRVPRRVPVGVGDDAAVVRGSSQDWLVTTDLLVEDVHFSLDTISFDDLGYKAAAANLSDIAAMGGTPTSLVVALAIPKTVSQADLSRLYRGIHRACRPYKVSLIGGDTSASRGGLFLSITLFGEVARDRAILRSGAKPGDLLYVSGRLGESRAGLMLLENAQAPRIRSGLRRADRARLIGRHRHPTPRVTLGQALSSQRLATAMIDLSDGLTGDLAHLCEESRVGALLDCSALPLSPALRRFAMLAGSSADLLALQGGEDYELLFTLSPRHETAVVRLGQRLNVAVTRIGLMMPARFGMKQQDGHGNLKDLVITSYRHFT